MRFLIIFTRGLGKGLVWKVDGGFNGDTICQTTLQQGKFEGYGSQLWTLETV